MADIRKSWEKTLRSFKTYLSLERALAQNSVEAYLRDASAFAEFAIGECGRSAVQISREDIDSYTAHLTQRGVAISSSARALSSLRSLFEWLAETAQRQDIPTALTSQPKAPRHLPQLLTIDEIDRMIAAINTSNGTKGVRDRAIIELLYSCGLRVSELVGLQLGDLFFEEGYIRITGKGSKQRLVPISGSAMALVRSYIALREPKNADEATLFLNSRGAKLSRISIFNFVKAAAKAADVTTQLSPHTLRHSFATHMLQGGASVRQVQELLGHESITTTEIYTHVSQEHLLDTLEILIE